MIYFPFINNKKMSTKEQPCSRRHFDHINPDDFMKMDYYRPPNLTIKEAAFVKHYVDRMSKFILADEIDLVKQSYQYLVITEKYSGSHDRMKTYYMIVCTIDAMLRSMCRVQNATLKYIFHIPFGPTDENIRPNEIRLDKLESAINTDLMSKEISELIVDNPFIYEIAWTCLVEKLKSIRELVGVGIRLSLEYEMRWGYFCDRECCKLPDKYKYDNYL